MMEIAIYLLCALTALLVSVMLWRGFARTRSRLLLHAGTCFFFLMISNVLLFIDRIILPAINLSNLTASAAILGMLVLLVAMINAGDRL